MISMFDVFSSAQSNAQRISVENRDSIIRTNQSIITTGAGVSPSNIFTVKNGTNIGQTQVDLDQVAPNTLNRIPRIVGKCVTGGVVIDRSSIHQSSNSESITSYILVLGHTHIAQTWSSVNTSSEAELTALKDTRFFTDPNGVIVSSVRPGFCIDALEVTPNLEENCWSNTYQPEIYWNGDLCIFKGDGVVEALADPVNYAADPTDVNPINDNFRVAVYVGNTDGSNQVFPGNGQDADQYARIPPATSMDGLVFACIEVTSDPDLDITGLGEWKFGIDNVSNYLPDTNLLTRDRQNNPSLILQKYLTEGRYGLGLDPNLLDQPSFDAWRLACKDDIGNSYGGDPGEWVYQDPDNSSGTFTEAPWMVTDNVINTSLSVGDNIKRITQSGLAQLHWDHEIQKFRIISQRKQVISDIDNLFKFNADNIIGRINISSGDFFNLPSYAQVTYPDRRLLSSENSIRMEVAQSDQAPNEPQNGANFNFPMISGRARAQVMANISLYENREDTIIEFNADYTTRDNKVGDYVTINDPGQALDNQIARIIKITEQITADGGLFYSYQFKKYSDKPFLAQTYTDDPYASTAPNLVTSDPTYIRVVQAIVFDQPQVSPGTITQIDYYYDTNDNTDVTPSSTRVRTLPKLSMPINYGYPSFDSGNTFVAFAIEGTAADMDRLEVQAQVSDDFYMPTYGGQTYTFESPLDGDPNYSGNTRYFILKDSKLGQSGTTSQPNNYNYKFKFWNSLTYPYAETNVWQANIAQTTWDITGNAMVTNLAGDDIITFEPGGTYPTSTTGGTPPQTYLYDVGQFKADNYYLSVGGVCNIGTRPGVPGTNYNIDTISHVEVVVTANVEYDTDQCEFPTGDSTIPGYTDRWTKAYRKYRIMSRLDHSQLKANTDIDFKDQIAVEFYNNAGLEFPGKATIDVSLKSYILWVDTEPYVPPTPPPYPEQPTETSRSCEILNSRVTGYQLINFSDRPQLRVYNPIECVPTPYVPGPNILQNATISDFKYEIRNNSRMRDE